jgi:hypothetical protein
MANYRTSSGGTEVARGMPGPESAYHGSFFEASGRRSTGGAW